MTDLGFIDEKPITGRSMKLSKAGDGLSEALKLKAADIHVGDPVAVLVRGTVKGPTFKPDKDNKGQDGYVRIDNIEAASAVIVEDDQQVEAILDAHEAAIAELRMREKEEKEGLKRIPFDEETDKTQAAEDGLTPGDAPGLRSIDGGGEGDESADG